MQILPLWRRESLKANYETIILGAGLHGLALAYYLSRQGMVKVAVLEADCLGGESPSSRTVIAGAPARTAAIAEHVNASAAIWATLGAELEYNLGYHSFPHLAIAEYADDVASLKRRMALHHNSNTACSMLDLDAVASRIPGINLRIVKAGLLQPSACRFRRDAAIWGFSLCANLNGVELHPFTQVKELNVRTGVVRGVVTNNGLVSADNVVVTDETLASRLLGLPLVPWKAATLETERFHPQWNVSIELESERLAVHHTDRGSLMVVETRPNSAGANDCRMEHLAASLLRYFPDLSPIQMLKHWRTCHFGASDGDPLLGSVEGTSRLFVDFGWGWHEPQTAPSAAQALADLIVRGKGNSSLMPWSSKRISH